MKLKYRNITPAGGWYFTYDLKRGDNIFHAKVYGSTLENLLENIKKDMGANSHPIPPDISYQVEHQICLRQPKGSCWPQTGDKVANTIHSVARVIDKVTGTNLEQKAKGCSVCGKRRDKLNKIL